MDLWYVMMVIVVGAALALAVQLLWHRARTAQQAAQQELAILQFGELRQALGPAFLEAAAATGKPRGLRWKQCELEPTELFAIDQATREIVALVAVTIGFEAIPGGDMEEVEAVGNLRRATAVFVYRQREWTTDGRAVFNLEPEQTLQRFAESIVPLE